jgi:hypothetical protein
MEQKIKASDLRIGNLVMTNNSMYRDESVGKIAVITQIDSKRTCEEIKGTVSLYLIEDIWKDTYGQWLIYIEPIPITEEWLLKFGYNCVNNTKMVFKLYHNDENADFSSLILKEVGNNPIWVYSVNNRWTINPFPIDLKYVHQLQNIYFALTGEELIMKQ